MFGALIGDLAGSVYNPRRNRRKLAGKTRGWQCF